MSRVPSGRPALADAADRHALYQRAVNAPGATIAFLRRVFLATRGRAPRVLKEDFCGTALLAVAWARRSPLHRAIGIDRDDEPLAWGRRHNLGACRPGVARRVELVRADVLEDSPYRADLVCALNFSVCLLTTRARLLTYLRGARGCLEPGGLLVLDCAGGSDLAGDCRERRDCGDFTYVWTQERFNPLDHRVRCSIGFEFPDGSRLAGAFVYDWRVWSLPELRDCLHEAGFASVRVFWEYEGEGGEADVREVERERSQERWLTYVVAAP